MNAIGEMKLGFGEGVAGISPGFMPPPGDAGYGVIPGEQYFWVLQVNNSGTTPVDSEFLERFPQDSNEHDRGQVLQNNTGGPGSGLAK